MYKYIIPSLFLATPFLASAQSLQEFIGGFLGFANNVIIPFLLGIGFLFFMINAIRYFVWQGAEQEGREKAKNLAIYSITGFVLIVIFWGIINMIASSIGLAGTAQPVTDYEDPNSVQTTGIPTANTNSNVNSPSGTTNNPTVNPSTVPTNQNTNSNGWYSNQSNTGAGASTTGNTAANQGSWFYQLFQTFPRPFRDYFWANWGSGSGSGWSGGSWGGSSGGSNATSLIDCLLPTGMIDQLTYKECTDLGGTEYIPNNTPGRGSSTGPLIDCDFVDPRTGQTRTIRATQQDCDDFNAMNIY